MYNNEIGNKFVANSYIVVDGKTIYLENKLEDIQKKIESKFKEDIIWVDVALIVTERTISINKKSITDYGKV